MRHVIFNHYVYPTKGFALCVVKHTEMTDKQTGTETKKRTFTDAVKKGKLLQDLLSKGPVEQLNEVYGKELNRLGRASLPTEAHNLVKI